MRFVLVLVLGLGLGLVLVLTLLTATSAFGQETLNPGDRVKIKTSDRGQTIVGTVQAILADRIDLAEGPAVERTTIRSIHRSQGMGTCLKRGAIIGAIAGVLIGGAFVGSQACLAIACVDETGADCSKPCPEPVPAVLNAMPAIGAAFGAAAGYQFKRERWTRVRLSITTSPVVVRRGVSPAIDLTFTW